MEIASPYPSTRLPRFRRSPEPPAFRVTDADLELIRHLAQHRFLRSTHLATLVGRSLDRTNDRLSKLYHAGYIDRPRAQLDYYPTSGSAPFAYALADRGARLLVERLGSDLADVEWSRKNRRAGRPFIEHQLAIAEFYLSLHAAARDRGDLRLIHPDEIVAAFPESQRSARNPLALRAKVSHKGQTREVGLVPDLVFGLDGRGGRRTFMVEIDRGTMPVTRSDLSQTSFERKMRAYLAIHAAKQHERQFGWRTFRVLTVTTDDRRAQSMREAAQLLNVSRSLGPSLFLFNTFGQLLGRDPVGELWADGHGRAASLIEP